MAQRIFATIVVSLILGAGAVSGQPQPRTVFKERANLSDIEIQKIDQGQVVTKVLSSNDKYGMLIFGAKGEVDESTKSISGERAF